MRNRIDIVEYLGIEENEMEQDVLNAMLDYCELVEKLYAKQLDNGTYGYCLTCDFEGEQNRVEDMERYKLKPISQGTYITVYEKVLLPFKEQILLREMSEKSFACLLETMVHRRMSISQMEEHLNSRLKVEHKVWLYRCSNWDSNELADYNLIGSTEQAREVDKTIPYCDFDIYVLPTKERDDYGCTVYYITEVGYEFQ